MSTTMIALGLAAVGTQPCGLDQTLSHVLSRPHPEAAAFLNGSKEERDAFGLPSSMSSDNFVLRWGEGSTASDEELASLLASFELAWAAQFEDWGYPQPVGTDAYKFNVYVGNTHEAGPDIDGAWGYFTVDADDHPYIVMDPRTVTDVSQGQITSAHELFHAAQHATGNYSSLNRSWYWEATATWAAETLHPDSGEGLELLYRYALSPHLSMEEYDRSDPYDIAYGRQYGAFIFPRYLAEHHGADDLILASWTEDVGSDPMRELDWLLADEGLDLHELLADFAARNLVWDYDNGAAYAEALDDVSSVFDDQDGRLADTVGPSGTDGWEEVAQDLAPHHTGTSAVRLDRMPAGELEVGFSGDGEGDEGSSVTWEVRIVRDSDDGLEVEPLVLDDGREGRRTLTLVGETELWIVAVPVANWPHEDESFSYALDVVPTVPASQGENEAEPDEEPSGCACQDRGAPGDWRGALLVLLLPLLRRRGRTARSDAA